MHCAANNAGQGRHRLSAGRGKFLEKLVCGRCADQPQQGGIVFDSDPYDEWMETINKLGVHSGPLETCLFWRGACLLTGMTGANMQCITTAEQKHLDEQAAAEDAAPVGSASSPDTRAHISLAA
jgi:hypothetical protein